MRVVLEYGSEGPLREGFWTAVAESGHKTRITGKQASMISLILSGYVFQGNFQPFDAFTQESLEAGRPPAGALPSRREESSQ